MAFFIIRGLLSCYWGVYMDPYWGVHLENMRVSGNVHSSGKMGVEEFLVFSIFSPGKKVGGTIADIEQSILKR